MKKQICALAIAAVLASPSVFAQSTCANAEVIRAPGGPYAGNTDTDGAADIDGIGGYPVGGAKSVKWKFTAGAEPVNGTLTVDASFAWGLYVTPNCQTVTSNPLGIAASTDAHTITLQPARFTAGSTYYVILTSDPSSANAADNGPFSLAVTETLPVTLQEFSID